MPIFDQVEILDVDYRSKRSGDWHDWTIWTYKDAISGLFVNSAKGNYPGKTNKVFIQALHVIHFTFNGECLDFNIETTASLNTDGFCLFIDGKIRKFTGSAPGTEDPAGGAEGFLGDLSILVFRGVANKTIATETEFGQTANGGFKTVIDYGSFKASLSGNNRLGSDVEIKTGTFEVLNGTTNIGLEVRPADGAADTTKTSILIKALARFNFDGRPGQSATVGFGSYVLELGAFLGIKGAAVFVKAENTLSLLGTVELTEAFVQDFPTRQDAGELAVDTFATVLLAGGFDKTLILNIAVNTLFQIDSNLNVLGAFTITYGAGSGLHYRNNTVKRTTTSTEYPIINQPDNLICEDPFDIALNENKNPKTVEIRKGRLDVRDFTLTDLLVTFSAFSSGFGFGFN